MHKRTKALGENLEPQFHVESSLATSLYRTFRRRPKVGFYEDFTEPLESPACRRARFFARGNRARFSSEQLGRSKPLPRTPPKTKRLKASPYSNALAKPYDLTRPEALSQAPLAQRQRDGFPTGQDLVHFPHRSASSGEMKGSAQSGIFQYTVPELLNKAFHVHREMSPRRAASISISAPPCRIRYGTFRIWHQHQWFFAMLVRTFPAMGFPPYIDIMHAGQRQHRRRFTASFHLHAGIQRGEAREYSYADSCVHVT